MVDTPELLELNTHAMAVGGDAVARDANGRVVFVAGALDGEQVRVRIRSTHKRFAHADLLEVVEPSPHRQVPVCPHVSQGCGGCGWAHVDPAAQRRHKVAAIGESLQRLGRIEAPVVEPGPDLVTTGFRTTVRAAIIEGRAGYRKAAGDDRLAVDSCRVAHPLIEELITGGQFGSADEAVLRAGARTGERLVRVSPGVDDAVVVPEDVVLVGDDRLAAGERAWVHEEVRGVRLRISAESFFQSRADGADALVDAVNDAVAAAGPGAAMADLYCGVGLFAATVGRERRVVAVERSRSSIADARVNLADQDAKIIRVGVERWRPSPVDVVVADPPRAGLGRVGVDKVNATGAGVLALVSCDAAALGRDAGLLTASGWTPHWFRLIDLFPDTPHVEVVSLFTR